MIENGNNAFHKCELCKVNKVKVFHVLFPLKNGIAKANLCDKCISNLFNYFIGILKKNDHELYLTICDKFGSLLTDCIEANHYKFWRKEEERTRK